MWVTTLLFYLLAKQGVQLFWDVVLFVLDLVLSQSDCNVWISFPVNVSWVQISRLPKKKEDNLSFYWDIYHSISLKCSKVEYTSAYPDHIDADENIDGIVVRNVLKHSHVGVHVHVSGHVIRHFVHAHRALKKEAVTKKCWEKHIT